MGIQITFESCAIIEDTKKKQKRETNLFVDKTEWLIIK
jgi:hypothetical protein